MTNTAADQRPDSATPTATVERSVPTQAQLDAYDELTRLVTAADDPRAAARRLLDVIGAEKARAGRRPEWSISTTNGVTVTGYLPAWADKDPSETGVAADRLELNLIDINFYRGYPGQTVTIDTGAYETDNGKRYLGDLDILCAQIDCMPHATDPDLRVPVVNIELMHGGDDWIHGLDPAGVTGLASKLRAQANRLDQVAVDLTAYRADWADRHSESRAALTPPTPAYVPPTDFEHAESITLAGAEGATLKAYLNAPEWEGVLDGPMTMAVLSEPLSDGDLDLDGANKLIADLEALLPKLRAMRDVLAAQPREEAVPAWPASPRPTSECVYDGAPSVQVRTGQNGNEYGLCADCAKVTDAMAARGGAW